MKFAKFSTSNLLRSEENDYIKSALGMVGQPSEC